MNPLYARVLYLRARLHSALYRTLGSLRSRGVAGTLRRAWREMAPPARLIARPLALPAADAPIALPTTADAPRISVVVPVCNHLDHSLQCLRALSQCTDAASWELIIVDDASSDASAMTLPAITGLRYHRNADNLGFIGACNAGARLARGEYLVLLNNDTAPQSGWLDAMLRTFQTHPRTGLVGARLVFPDGRLQEAGGILFSTGQAFQDGRFQDRDDPRFNYVRDVDYCSGAALMLPRALFDSLGGFDARYAPAYYEDADLAMKVRAQGLRVLYQPLATVVHFEGVSAGTDLATGPKSAQVRNRQLFFERWRDTLAARHPRPGTDPALARDRHGGRRVLIVDAYTPMPDRDSSSLRLLNLMRLLREENGTVTFLPTDGRHAGTYTEALRQQGAEVWHDPWLGSIPVWFATHGARFDVIIACRYHVAEGILPLARVHAPKARFVFDTVDLHYLRETRGAALDGDDGGRRAAQRTRARELDLIRSADSTWVVSTVEQALLAREVPGARVEVVSNVHAVAGPGKPFDARRDLVFVGGFRHPPNVDAVLWFADEIFPRVRAALPGVRLHLIGAEPPQTVRVLASREGITVHGYVPDLAPWMDGARIALAPLRYGAGVKGKLNLSMAHGQPAVATRCAVEGMHLEDGHSVLIADDAEDFATALVRLYQDRALWERLSANGLDNVRRHFSFEAARAALRQALDLGNCL